MPTRDDLITDAAIAVLAFGVSLALLAADNFDAAGVALTGLATLPLVARRRAPLAIFVLTALASIALRSVAEPVGPPIGPTVALYGLAESGAPRASLVVVATLLVAHVTAVGLSQDEFPGAPLVFGVVLWSGVWLAGDRARLRAERMHELEERAVRAEREAERDRRLAAAEERMRIARDLHDSAGHAINVILVHAGMGRLKSERDPDGARQAFATIEEVARETVAEIDQLVGALRDDGDGGVEPPPGVAAFDGLLERNRAAGLDVTATIRGERRALSPGVDRGAYRILQEALTNAARHGEGSARVEIDFEERALELTVANPARRDGPETGAGGHGLIGMRERAALLGGTVEAGYRNGSFEVRARLPLDGRRA